MTQRTNVMLCRAALAAVLMFSNGVLAELLGQGAALQGLRNLSFPPGSGPLAAGACILKWYFQKLLPIAFLRGFHIALPLAAITALGQRFYFLPTLILIMLAMDLAAPLLTARAGTWAAGLVTVGLMLLWGYRGTVTAACTLARSAEISRAAAAGEKQLVLPTDRYYRIFWVDRNPWNVEYASYFREFYGISEDVTLIFLPGGSDETWPDYTQEQWENRLEFAPSDDFVPSLPQ